MTGIKTIKQTMKLCEHYVATLQQGIDFVEQLTNKEYSCSIDRNSSPIGSHVRHILDHYYSVKIGFDTQRVDYELRERGSLVETSKSEALVQLVALQVWISSLSEDLLNQTVSVHSDVGIGSCHIIEVESTLARELMFASSHAIHHYATLKQVYQLIGGKFNDAEFGLASSTATFIKQQSEAC